MGEVANYIVEATGADAFELELVEPYSDDDLNWTDDNSRVVYEHDNLDQRTVELVASTVPDWETYNTVYIGYPIWLAYHNLIQWKTAEMRGNKPFHGFCRFDFQLLMSVAVMQGLSCLALLHLFLTIARQSLNLISYR